MTHGTDVLALFASLALMALLVAVLWMAIEAAKVILTKKYGGKSHEQRD